MSVPKVLVLGGTGFYGGYVVRDLLESSPYSIVIGGRRSGRGLDDRTTSVPVDLRDVETLARVLTGVDLVIHCAGPFTRLPLSVVDAAIAAGVPYVDIAEDRAFFREVSSRSHAASSAGVPLLSGISVCPAMEALAVRHLGDGLESVQSSRTFAAPDTRRHRGPAMFETMLYGSGRPFVQPLVGGGHRATFGWSEPEWLEFPPPVGRRLTFLIHDMADLDVLPALFGVEHVSFKAGSEWPVLNALVGLAAQVRHRLGHPEWTRFARPARVLSRLAGLFGRDVGAVVFEVSGRRSGAPMTAMLGIVAQRDGGRIPSVLASIAAQEVLAGRYTRPGVANPGAWIEPERWLSEMRRRGFVASRRSTRNHPWVVT